jgi:cystathionine beta-lyase
VNESKSLQTLLAHSDYTPPDGFAAFPTPIHHASTVIFENVAAMRSRKWQDKSGYTYGLHGTPTTYTLAPSGLAAIAMLDFALLKSGDDVLIPNNSYYPNRELAEWLQRDFGVSARYYDPLIGSGIAALIQPNTRLIWAEAPGSVSIEVPDIPAICRAAHAHSVVVALDNTWSGGIAFKAFEHGVDIVMQALTKYQSGGSDVLMGALITRDVALQRKIQLAHAHLGFNVGMDDVYLMLRGLSTLKLRFDAHDTGARTIAAWLAERVEVVRMLHPAYPDCPGHEIWQRDFTGAGGLFSVVLDERFDEAQTDAFVDSLRLFKIGYSWGGAHSLCVPYRMRSMREGWAHQGTLVRFFIGLEHPHDLIADIEQAMKAALKPASPYSRSGP